MITHRKVKLQTEAFGSKLALWSIGLAIFIVLGVGNLVLAQKPETVSTTERMEQAWLQHVIGPRLTALYTELMTSPAAKVVILPGRPIDERTAVAVARRLEIHKLDVEIQLLNLQVEYLNSRDVIPDKGLQDAYRTRIEGLESLKAGLAEKIPLPTAEVAR